MFLLLGFAFFPQLNAQVKSVKYELKHNQQTGLFDCYLLIDEGNAISKRERLQFFSQISLVVPTNSIVKVEKTYMPLQNNQEYKGTTPIEWDLQKPLRAPSASPKMDFYSLVPVLSPSAFYNDIKQGDKILLFSVNVKTDKLDDVRLYNTAIDPDATAIGMKGRDFTNGFCIGGAQNYYTGR